MTRVDFYLLPTSDARERLVWVCRLAEKAYRGGHRIHIHSRDGAEAQVLDDLLWSFRASSFVPHLRLGAAEPDEFTPVTLGQGDQRPEDCDVLINLAPAIPEWNGRFQRIAELVPQGDEERHMSREHFRQYKALGYQLETHDLETAPPMNG
ncbi:DNA polymerase III subunit chi [Methylogaea oryzae]|uniref:DNA polymerase III subunit chi n=1 Tax=Methylogaea oryzae TaxID=1295382 RepID=A0A8D5AJI1_9GAMM|nr:DNA polymerase III subunit chi [Methylogaea oryzae]BBL70081.1 DNA polymerase III subunit chi [Methylogaea oryzae]